MRKRYEEDENRLPWIFRFLGGVLVAAPFCAIALSVISLYILPPPAPPPDPAATAPTGPVFINGIEVATTPAYTAPASAPVPETIGPLDLGGPAIAVNAVAFDAEAATPLIAVVLDDSAADPLLHGVLFTIGVPLTIGVIAGDAGDRETAKAARAAGFEVVAELPLMGPGLGGELALEYGMSEVAAAARADMLMRRLPMAVAVSRPMAAATPPNGTVLRGIDGALAPHGFGYLDHGVAVLDQSTAAAAGLAMSVTASRYAIAPGASAAEAIAVLDQAASDAALRGTAVVFASPNQEVLLAMQLWGGTGDASAVQLAPLSAVIWRESGG